MRAESELYSIGDRTTDVAVFCLALMGTDYPSYLREATRVLNSAGRLWIAEVRSRFMSQRGEDFESFISALKLLGYKLIEANAQNQMFVVFEFQKVASATIDKAIAWPSLKPCIYKRR